SYKGDYARGCRHHDFIGHHLRADRVYDRLRPAVRQSVWMDDGVLGDGIDAGELHADADAQLANAQAAGEKTLRPRGRSGGHRSRITGHASRRTHVKGDALLRLY